MRVMERSTDLRLPTVAVPIRLALVGHEVAQAELFVGERARQGRGQLLDDLAAQLDELEPFLPIRGSEGVRLLGKHAIAWIAVARHVDPPGAAPLEPRPAEVTLDEVTLYDRKHRVAIELLAGDTLTGVLLDSFPPDRPRVVDHLNRAVQFVRLWTSDEHYLINKRQILQVTELTSSVE